MKLIFLSDFARMTPPVEVEEKLIQADECGEGRCQRKSSSVKFEKKVVRLLCFDR